jgi:hypothetical protein
MGYSETHLNRLLSASFYKEKGIVLFGHGLIFSLAQLPVGFAWSFTLALVVVLTAQLLGPSAVYLAMFVFYAVTVLLLGVANAKLSEYIYDVRPDYGPYPLLMQGLVLFVASQVLVNPLSDLLEATADPLVGFTIIIFRYTVISFVIGILCFALGTTLVERRKTVVFGHSPERPQPEYYVEERQGETRSEDTEQVKSEGEHQ